MKKNSIKFTQKELKYLIHYDPEIGVVTRKVSTSSKARKGNIVGSLGKNGYLYVHIFGKQRLLHRLIWFYMEGYMPEHQIDHIDRDPLNNKWNNLREVSQYCNMRNCGMYKRNTSGITGVSWDTLYKKWNSYITIARKKINLGYFRNKLDAAKARWEAEKKYGYPNCNTTSSAYQYIKEYGKLDKKGE